jgi:uncharacterized protein
MIHLTPADYKVMTWANGMGTTTELARKADADGGLRYRLSVAVVAEDGPFSILPGIHRSLTVISGPGFDLVGDTTLRAETLVPIAFDGGMTWAAAHVSGPSEDFNVMVTKDFLAPTVVVLRDGQALVSDGPMSFCFALGHLSLGNVAMGPRDLLVRPPDGVITGGPAILITIGP